MGILARLFGQTGTVRFEGETLDGRHFGGKTEIESFNASNAEVEEELKNLLWVHNGVRVKWLKLTGFAERR